MTIKLSRRLAAIASHIPSGGFADVGTDHGYIPAALASEGYSGRIVACDIKPGPLDAARKTAAQLGVSDKLEFILCDGLTAVSPDTLGCVVIAGMGGEVMTAILEAAPWTREKGVLLVLQPMSKSELLRAWLYENGWRVASEELCEDGILYEILTATPGSDLPLSPAEALLGRIAQISGDPLYPARRAELIEKLSHEVEGLKKSKKASDEQRLRQEQEILNELKAL